MDKQSVSSLKPSRHVLSQDSELQHAERITSMESCCDEYLTLPNAIIAVEIQLVPGELYRGLIRRSRLWYNQNLL